MAGSRQFSIPGLFRRALRRDVAVFKYLSLSLIAAFKSSISFSVSAIDCRVCSYSAEDYDPRENGFVSKGTFSLPFQEKLEFDCEHL